ncbi:hypothetical protein [Streptomyces sp. NPDC086989]|uniref:hypothetical protein n=1 Tax=Streptomyces sp. NPDC086989 TaxID=3365764 RepID=UPI0038079531
MTLPSRLLPEPLGAGLSCAQARETARAVLAGLDLLAAGVDGRADRGDRDVLQRQPPAGGATAFQITARAGIVTVEVRARSTAPPRIKPWAPDEPRGFG